MGTEHREIERCKNHRPTKTVIAMESPALPCQLLKSAMMPPPSDLDVPLLVTALQQLHFLVCGPPSTSNSVLPPACTQSASQSTPPHPLIVACAGELFAFFSP